MMKNEDQDHILSIEDAGRSTPQPVLSWRSCLEMIAKVPMPVWNRISIISSVIGVSADPLFFYVPFIDEENKCIGVDKKLRIAVLILRSLTDSTTLVYIMHHIRKTLFKHVGSESTGWNWNIAKKSFLKFLFQILIVLPVPQVLVLVLFFRMRGDKYFEDRMMMNIFLLVQYVPRMYQIYLLSKQLTKHVGILIKGVFYLFMYILASHILGAFFYFLSIQRVTSCWHQTCRITGGCRTTYHCGDHTSTSVNITLLTELCPISPSNATMFDFGIFGNGLQSGNLGLKDFSEKVFYFVWWGLRNLSNFGTNLETSSYLWENCLAILISVMGLLLFLYLIGNVQQCMQWEAEKDEVLKRLKKSKENIEFWMDDRGVDDEKLRKEIMADIDNIPEEKKGADLDDLFSILSEETSKSLKYLLCMKMLKNVPKLQGMTDFVLRSICSYLEPVLYKDGSFFVKVGEPLDRLILVTDGNMLVYSSNSIHRSVEDGGVYGDEQLLSWASSSSNMFVSLTNIPISKENVKCITKVKGFVIRAEDLGKMSMYKHTRNSTESNLGKEIAFSSISTETSPFSNQPTSTVPTLDVDPTSFKGL
ncbi:hypothetical protein ACLB2K_076658 [Fragaria x ananassa]